MNEVRARQLLEQASVRLADSFDAFGHDRRFERAIGDFLAGVPAWRYEFSPCRTTRSPTGDENVDACCAEADAQFWGVYKRNINADPPVAVHVADFVDKDDAQAYVHWMNRT